VRIRGIVVVLAWLAIAPATAAALTVTEYGSRATLDGPQGITAGPDGDVWFAENGANKIGRITLDGAITLFSDDKSLLPKPYDITLGADGNLWFTVTLGNRIGRITPGGVITLFPDNVTTLNDPVWITTGADGNVWFVDHENGSALAEIGRITPDGTITEFPAPGGAAFSLARGSDGNVWFQTGTAVPEIARIDPAGTTTVVPNTMGLSSPIAGPDGNIWVRRRSTNGLAQITPAGVITDVPNFADPYIGPITAGPDGNVWFADYGNAGGQIGRITPTGVVTFYPAPIAQDILEMTAGPDGTLWFTDQTNEAIGKISDLSSVTAPVTPPPAGVAAKLSALAISPRTFRVGRTGATVHFTLNTAASAIFTVQQSRPGRRAASGRCTAPTRRTRHARPCTRTVRIPGHVTRSGVGGRNTFRFTGRLNGHALKAGNYRLAAHLMTPGATTATVAFTIAKPHVAVHGRAHAS
jgi:virginiamycin B lyase